MNATHVERRAPASPVPEPLPGDPLGLRSALEAVIGRWRLATAVFCTVLGLFALGTWMAEPVYRADTLLRIDTQRRDSLVPAPAGSDRALAEGSRGSVVGEQSLLTSRALLLPLIAASGADIEVGPALRRSGLPAGGSHGVRIASLHLPEEWRGRRLSLGVAGGTWALLDAEGRLLAEGQAGRPLNFAVDGQPAQITVQAPADGPALSLSLRLLPPLQAYEDVLKRLRVLELSRDSGVLRLTYDDPSADRAAALLNAMVQSYLDETVRRKGAEGDRALAFVEAQLPPMKARLEEAERALSSHLQRTRVIVPSAESEALLRQRGDLERQLVDLQVRREQLALNVTPEHPELAAVLRQIGTLRSAIDGLGASTGRLPEQGRELARLQRVVQSETQLYTTMLQHAQQLRLGRGSWLPNAVHVDRAVVPTVPVRPRWITSLSIGAAAGLVLALGSVLLARALQPTIDPLRGLQARFTPPTLAMIPDSAAQRRLMAGALDGSEVHEDSLRELGMHRLLARTAPDDPAVEALRAILLALVARERTGPAQVVMLTSPATGTGKSFVAANLAAVMAEGGRKVLLIDADARHSGLHRLVGLDPRSEGLSDALARRRMDRDTIHRHPTAGFDVLPYGTRSRSRATALLSPAMEPLLRVLREHYDQIVINASPALQGQETAFLGRLADLAYLVVRPEQSGVQESRQAVQRLAQAGVKVEGLVFNGVRLSRLNAHLLA